MRRTSRVSAVLTAAVTALALAGTAGAATPEPDRAPTAPVAGNPTTHDQAPATRAATTERRRGKQPTRFAMKAKAYGTWITGGQVPVESGHTALSVLTCTNETGRYRSNEVAEVQVPEGYGSVRVVNTELETRRAKRGRETHVWSKSEVAGITLMESSIGSLEIGAFTSVSHAWHGPDGFHAEVKNTPAAIMFYPADGGEPQGFEFPSEQVPVIEIPGLAVIELGTKQGIAKRNAALAYGNALRIRVVPSNSLVRVGHTNAYIGDGITHGLFKGGAYGVAASALDGLVRIGRNPNTPMPCQGTGGELRQKSLVDVGPPGSALDGQIDVSALTTSAHGVQTRRKTQGWTQAQVASVKLGGGAFEIRGIVARANAKLLKGGKVRVNSKGTTLGAFYADGQEQGAFPDPGQPIEIPGGVLKIETNVVDKSRRGIQVTAIRITVLEGTAAGTVVNIANAQLRIERSGL